MTIYTAPLVQVRGGLFAVQCLLQGSEAALLLVTATSPRTALVPQIVEQLRLSQIRTPTPIRGRARPVFLLDEGVSIGNYRLPEAVVRVQAAAGQFGVQGILGLDWLTEFYRVCINRRTLELEMPADP